jgi:hypothetical protein
VSRGRAYSSTLSLTSALDGGEWSTPRPCRFAGDDPLPTVQEARRAPKPVWTSAENFAPTGIRSPDRPARSEYNSSFHHFVLSVLELKSAIRPVL